jgi:hypothetical protein
VKIGKTVQRVETRMKSLDSTGAPLLFVCFFAARVEDIDFVERQLHDAFGDQRVRKNREFFEIDPARVAAALKLCALEDVTPRDDVVETEDDQFAVDKARSRGGMFNIVRIGIEEGATLVFTKDESLTAKVKSAYEIEFEGNITSLAAAALVVIKRLGYTWRQIRGPQYGMYAGETLFERKNRLGGE